MLAIPLKPFLALLVSSFGYGFHGSETEGDFIAAIETGVGMECFHTAQWWTEQRDGVQLQFDKIGVETFVASDLPAHDASLLSVNNFFAAMVAKGNSFGNGFRDGGFHKKMQSQCVFPFLFGLLVQYSRFDIASAISSTRDSYMLRG